MEFESPNTREKCKPTHYLAELAVTRHANKLKVVLPFKFWNTDEWKKEYKQQIIAAHSLLKLFSIESILAALNSKDGNWIYSLNQPKIIDLAKQEEARLKMEIKINEQSQKLEYNPNNINKRPKSQGKDNILNKIRGLDG